ncbi:MAG: hypothetical protein M3345_02390 [Actinomycetota bacterium]|nr:hypothetical protein [Actinomycetota bacterium]
MGEQQVLKDEDIKRTWMRSGSVEGIAQNTDPDSTDSDGTDSQDTDGTDSTDTDNTDATDTDGTDSVPA